MYNIDETTGSGDLVSFVPGINEGFSIVDVKAERLKADDPNSKVVVNVYFNNGGNFDVKYTFFPVIESEVKEAAAANPQKAIYTDPKIGFKKGDIITPDQALEIAKKNFGAKVKGLFNKFIDDSKIKIAGADWKEFSANLVAFFVNNKAEMTNKVRIFLVYDGKYKFLNPRTFDWIESMSVNPSRLVAKPKDKLVKPTADSEGSSNGGGDILSGFSTSNESDPFAFPVN